MTREPRIGQPSYCARLGPSNVGHRRRGFSTRRGKFGVLWLYQATVVGFLGNLDPEGLLRASLVEKHHEITWPRGGSMTVLTSPEGERYVLVSRDARRVSDAPTIPSGWTLEVVRLREELTIRLPLRTTVIRADNEDSFQGPLPPDLVF